MVSFNILIAFISAVALLAFSPGPDNMYVAVQSARYGLKKGFVVILGLMTGCLVHTTFLAFGFAALFTEFPWLLYVVKSGGAFYLLYLAYGLYRERKMPLASLAATPSQPFFKLYVQGFFMNVLNPKVSLFFIAFFPGFLFLPQAPLWVQFYALGFVFIGVSTIVFMGIATLASQLILVQNGNNRFYKALSWVQILLFIGIAVFLLLP